MSCAVTVVDGIPAQEMLLQPSDAGADTGRSAWVAEEEPWQSTATWVCLWRRAQRGRVRMWAAAPQRRAGGPGSTTGGQRQLCRCLPLWTDLWAVTRMSLPVLAVSLSHSRPSKIALQRTWAERRDTPTAGKWDEAVQFDRQDQGGRGRDSLSLRHGTDEQNPHYQCSVHERRNEEVHRAARHVIMELQRARDRESLPAAAFPWEGQKVAGAWTNLPGSSAASQSLKQKWRKKRFLFSKTRDFPECRLAQIDSRRSRNVRRPPAGQWVRQWWRNSLRKSGDEKVAWNGGVSVQTRHGPSQTLGRTVGRSVKSVLWGRCSTTQDTHTGTKPPLNTGSRIQERIENTLVTRGFIPVIQRCDHSPPVWQPW